MGTIELGEVRRLVMDEFACTRDTAMPPVIMDAERTRVLGWGTATAGTAIRPFFEQLGERCQQIEAVAMDMNTAFDLEVKQHCPPGGRWSTTCSRVVARYGRVVDRVRVEQANALKAINRREKWSKVRVGFCPYRAEVE